MTDRKKHFPVWRRWLVPEPKIDWSAGPFWHIMPSACDFARRQREVWGELEPEDKGEEG